MIRVVFHTYGILHETLRIRIQIAQISIHSRPPSLHIWQKSFVIDIFQSKVLALQSKTLGWYQFIRPLAFQLFYCAILELANLLP